MNLHAVVLCGGRGERFWPKSRRALPKQFIALFGRESLTQETSDRVRPLCPTARQLFVAPAEFEKVLRRQLGANARLVFEPLGRNTAPAIGLAAEYLKHEDPDATMLVLPADHLIEDGAAFLKAVRLGAQLAQDGMLVTFGIRPERADTGYGYVQLGKRIAGKDRLAAHRVQAFKEKPSPARARAYLAAGNYVWNSGMFIWRVDAILSAFEQFMPALYAELEAFGRTVGTRRQKAALARLYRKTPAISIDYAVMEKADNVACVRGAFDWDDVGSWLALARHIKPDHADNVANGVLVARNSSHCIVDSDAGVIAALGVKDLVIVRAGDAVLVADKDALAHIKPLLADVAALPHARRFL
ncbi:mannose-1-phosphate guanylyltransferase [candidate division WOR-3 bacterium]|nr:mannose-1-phosphate guanylyltransferase [candidate division WOR-3 bacterium]